MRFHQWDGKKFSLFPSYDFVLTTDASESCAENERIQFEEGFYNTDLPNLEISYLVSDDSNPISSSSLSHVSSSTGNILKSIGQTISRANTNPNSTTLETVSYSTFQSHVMSIIRIKSNVQLSC
ncbi:hypothetical protein ACTFIW_000862 [Dictyostelium discoideum]